MYVTHSNPSDPNFGEFGFIPWQAVVGIIQGAIYGGAAITKHSATQKYLKTQQHTQERTHAEQEELKAKELATKRLLLETEGKTQLYEDQQIKRLVIIGIITTLVVAVVGIGLYYALSVGDA